MKRRALLVGFLLLTGCASQLLPDDYAGATALVKDSHANYTEADGFKSDTVEIYAMTDVDGKSIYNALGSTIAETQRAGPLRIVGGERPVPIKLLKVQLKAMVFSTNTLFQSTHATANTVTFSPVAGETYVVRGKLRGESFDIWIETASGRRVTQ